MIFTYSWLKKHIDITENGKSLAEILTNLGLEVEKCQNLNDYYDEMYICEITEIDKHPNADNLKVCKVTSGKKKYKVVCGAKNTKIGLKTIFAPNGAFIPGKDFRLEKKNIRGIVGDGMLCSEEEIFFFGDKSGIIELDNNYSVGKKLSSYMLEEFIFEIGLTPNRGDCASVRGIARDLAAKFNKKIIEKKNKSYKGDFKSDIEWNLDFLEKDTDCSFILGRHFKIKKNKQSPSWLKKRLLSIGVNPLSSLVDITNYLLFDIGRPLHVFDAKKLVGNLKIMRAKKGDIFEGLNNKKYLLSEHDLVIADDEKIVSLAGIMGGSNSCVDENTKEVFLEVALFDSKLIAETGRKLNINSDARYRFERGIDPEGLYEGLDIATEMIISFCGGDFSLLEKKGEYKNEKNNIKFELSKFSKVIGYDLEKKKQINILKNLGFNVFNESNCCVVTPPSWRTDIKTENDITEEIARIEGYEKIPYNEFTNSKNVECKIFSKIKNLKIDCRDKLASIGFHELITFTFLSPEKIFPKSELKEELILSNPISSKLSVMRNSLYPNLLDAIAQNYSRGVEGMNFFEIGVVFNGNEYENQRSFLSMIKSGYTNHKNWACERREFDFYDIKADILDLLNHLGKEKQIKLKRTNSFWYHPGKSAEIVIDQSIIGSFGELHPTMKKFFNLKKNAYIAELKLEKISDYSTRKNVKRNFSASHFLSIKKDFAFVIDKNSSVEELSAVIRKSSNLIGEIIVFDIYDEKLKKNNRTSVALQVEIKQEEKVFNSEEINKLMSLIIKNVKEKLGAVLRD